MIFPKRDPIHPHLLLKAKGPTLIIQNLNKIQTFPITPEVSLDFDALHLFSQIYFKTGVKKDTGFCLV
jgi:hypothetical protein